MTLLLKTVCLWPWQDVSARLIWALHQHGLEQQPFVLKKEKIEKYIYVFSVQFAIFIYIHIYMRLSMKAIMNL